MTAVVSRADAIRWEYSLGASRIFARVNGVDVNRFRPLEEEGKAARRKAELALSSERMLRDALRVFESVTHVGDWHVRVALIAKLALISVVVGTTFLNVTTQRPRCIR